MSGTRKSRRQTLLEGLGFAPEPPEDPLKAKERQQKVWEESRARLVNRNSTFSALNLSCFVSPRFYEFMGGIHKNVGKDVGAGGAGTVSNPGQGLSGQAPQGIA